MALTFPSNPSNNQTYTFNGILHRYVSAKNAWVIESDTAAPTGTGGPFALPVGGTLTTVHSVTEGFTGNPPASYTVLTDGWYRINSYGGYQSSSGSNVTGAAGIGLSQQGFMVSGFYYMNTGNTDRWIPILAGITTGLIRSYTLPQNGVYHSPGVWALIHCSAGTVISGTITGQLESRTLVVARYT